MSALLVTKNYKMKNRTDKTKCSPRNQPTNLNLWLTNIRGLRSNKGQLEARIRNTPPSSKPDVILIVESKLESKVSDNSHHISLNGYSFMRRDRSDNSGWGGCLMYYKNGLPIVRETHLEPKRHELMIFTILKGGLPRPAVASCYKADWDGLRNKLAAATWNTCLNKDNPEEACSKITNTITDAMHQFIPQKSTSSFVDYPAWWNESCDKALKMKDKAWRRWKANQTPESRLGYNRARNEYTSTSRKACTAHKARIKDKMTNELHSGSKSWWWTANRLMDKGGKSEIPVLKSGGQTFMTAEEKAECFASFFSDKSTIPEAENSKDDTSSPPKDHR